MAGIGGVGGQSGIYNMGASQGKYEAINESFGNVAKLPSAKKTVKVEVRDREIPDRDAKKLMENMITAGALSIASAKFNQEGN